MISKIKTLTRTMSVLFILILIFGCSDNSETCFQKVEFTLIGKGELYGNGREKIDKSNFFIKNQVEWQNLINKMDSYNTVTKNFIEINIDFDNYIIIAVFDEIKKNGGHSIDVVDINLNKNNIVVSVSNLNNGDLTNVINQPFHIIKTPITERQITFDKN